ncbi:MAG: hypothetical protein AB8B63_21230 [Granulosicoccus sp.]
MSVKMQLLSADSAQFLHHLLSGKTIAEAASERLVKDDKFNTATHLQSQIGMGAFTAISD